MEKVLDMAISRVEQAIQDVKNLPEYQKTNEIVTCILALNMAKSRLCDLKEREVIQ